MTILLQLQMVSRHFGFTLTNSKKTFCCKNASISFLRAVPSFFIMFTFSPSNMPFAFRGEQLYLPL